MFKSKTVFVVGAGASAELGMPTGALLTSQIAQMLTLKREQFRSYFTNSNIYQAIEAEILRSGQRVDQAFGQYVRAADDIARNMHLASSIDNFLRTHHEDPIKTFVGKLAIVNCILKAEAATRIYVKLGKGDFPNFAELSDTWMNRLAKLLFNDIDKKDVESVFANISFICFNYDRCIEAFLAYAVESYFGIPRRDAEAIISKLKIIHPYGHVGVLALYGQAHSVPFGAVDAGGDPDIARQVRTFTERVEEQTVLTEMRELLDQAELIIFLGFAFHPINMELLGLGGPEQLSAKQIFGTTLNVSAFDTNGIINDLHTAFQNKRRDADLRFHLSSSRCVELFDEVGRSLPRL